MLQRSNTISHCPSHLAWFRFINQAIPNAPRPFWSISHNTKVIWRLASMARFASESTISFPIPLAAPVTSTTLGKRSGVRSRARYTSSFNETQSITLVMTSTMIADVSSSIVRVRVCESKQAGNYTITRGLSDLYPSSRHQVNVRFGGRGFLFCYNTSVMMICLMTRQTITIEQRVPWAYEREREREQKSRRSRRKALRNKDVIDAELRAV